jgi:8-oxo-dGTP pyrophosphatase MutT (NUDIX family)
VIILAITATHIRRVLRDYLDNYPEDKPALDAVHHLLDDGADLTSRKEFRGHATAGAVVIDADGRVLQVHHRALDKWLLPGGHLEPTDATLQAAAVREVAEETQIGADELTALGALPVHVDVHRIPANPSKGEPDHLHIDFRFAFRTTADVQELQSEEVVDSAWRDVDSLGETLRQRVALAVRYGR